MDGSTDNLTPAEVAKKTFGSRLRGVDPQEVTAYLEQVSAQLRTAETDRDAWKAEVERLRDEVTSLQESLVQQQAEPDEAALTEQLGQEAGRVLTEARAAAADRLAEAEADAADIIAAAEELHAERSRAADAEAERLRAAALDEERRRLEAADDEAGTIRDRAREDAESIRAEAGVDQQAADAEAARIVREAELTRRRILEDLARRRSAARRQIEQLRAGRERLLASHEVVRRALEEISEELNISMSEARAAAETAGHNVSDSTLEEIEAEIETAKLAGLLDTGPVPVVTPARTRVEKASEPTVEMTPIVTAENTPSSADEPETAVEAPTESEAPREPEASAEPEASEPEEAAASEDEVTAAVESEPVDDGREEAAAAPDIQRSDDAARGDDGDGPLAEVVSLTAARQDVDTDRHPANRRSTKPRDPEPESEPAPEPLEMVTAVDDADEPDEPSEPVEVEEPAEVVAEEVVDTNEAAEPAEDEELVEESVEPAAAEVEPEPEPDPEPEPEPESEPEADPARVDSLFARMRQTQDAAVVAEAAEADSGPDGEADTAAETGIAPQQRADEVGRKLKRVLADEQSEVLSTLRAGTDGASVETLLGSEADHRLRYWSATEAVLGDGVADAPEAEAEIGRLVEGIRRRVDACLTDVSDDPDAVVDRLRSVYREVKTQRIAEHSQIICGALKDLNAS